MVRKSRIDVYIYDINEYEKYISQYGENNVLNWYHELSCEFPRCNNMFWIKKSRLNKNKRIRHYCHKHKQEKYITNMYKLSEEYRIKNRKACNNYYYKIIKPKRELTNFLKIKVVKAIYCFIIT